MRINKNKLKSLQPKTKNLSKIYLILDKNSQISSFETMQSEINSSNKELQTKLDLEVESKNQEIQEFEHQKKELESNLEEKEKQLEMQKQQNEDHLKQIEELKKKNEELNKEKNQNFQQM